MDLKVPSILLPGIDNYIDNLIGNSKDIYIKHEEKAKNLQAPICGPQVGNILYMLCKLSSSKKVLELGSSIGYSTLWFANAVGTDGRVTYTDYLQTNANIARLAASEMGLDNQINFFVGDALQYLEKSEDTYDVIFIDLDKHLYLDAIKLALEKVKNGGIIIADNTLWSGRVRWNIKDEQTLSIQKYNEYVFNHHLLHSIILPVRDGLTISYKKD